MPATSASPISSQPSCAPSCSRGDEGGTATFNLDDDGSFGVPAIPLAWICAVVLAVLGGMQILRGGTKWTSAALGAGAFLFVFTFLAWAAAGSSFSLIGMLARLRQVGHAARARGTGRHPVRALGHHQHRHRGDAPQRRVHLRARRLDHQPLHRHRRSGVRVHAAGAAPRLAVDPLPRRPGDRRVRHQLLRPRPHVVPRRSRPHAEPRSQRGQHCQGMERPTPVGHPRDRPHPVRADVLRVRRDRARVPHRLGTVLDPLGTAHPRRRRAPEGRRNARHQRDPPAIRQRRRSPGRSPASAARGGRPTSDGSTRTSRTAVASSHSPSSSSVAGTRSARCWRR